MNIKRCCKKMYICISTSPPHPQLCASFKQKSMRLHQMTIKDIAKILNISTSTVSRALKDHPDISEETKEAVRRVAESVNYRPNALALSLRCAKTNIIGVVIPEMTHHFFSSVVAGMDETAQERGYNTMICQSNESLEREKKALQNLVDSRVDGILLSLSKETTDTEFLKQLVKEGVAIVTFDRVADDMEIGRVLTDDFKGANDAVNLMIRHGRRRIALLCGDPTLSVSQRRREGYEAALREAGIDIDESIIFDADTIDKIRTQYQELSRVSREIDGVFAINDTAAVAAMRIMRLANRKVPTEVEVVGFGDDPIANVTEPTLTSVEQNGKEMGRAAMEMLIEQIESGLVVSRATRKMLEPHLIERESTGGTSISENNLVLGGGVEILTH